MEERIVIKVSGSLIFPPRKDYMERLRDSIIRVLDAGYKIGIVVGGGSLAREYIATLREFGVPEAMLDIMGIESARLNALLLSMFLSPHTTPKVPKSLEEALEVFLDNHVPVLGGLQPGHSTNAVSILLAEALGSKVIVNMLNGIDGIYRKKEEIGRSNPIEKVTYDEMEEIIKGMKQLAGEYELLDHLGLELLRRNRIRIFYINGQEPDLLYRLIVKGERIGSMLSFS
ncbi:MAG: UMP kinase [Caldisphaeraceae archaeon]|nr:UMP kinase [Caldisphaeraceae archaeon]